MGISAEEFIVGLSEAEFTNLATFAQALRAILSSQKEVFTLVICSQLAITRIIPVSVALVNEWSSKSQGILGC